MRYYLNLREETPKGFLEDVLCHVLSIISQVLTSINFNLPNRFDRVMSNRGLKIIRKCKKVFLLKITLGHELAKI